MSPPGHFISFEGIDGAGKSSHIELLAAWWRARGREVLQTREPGGTPLAEALRALFLQCEMDALTEALLVFAGRRDHLRTVIRPALARGVVVLCDRFTDATFAYQGGGRGFDAALLAQLEQWVQQPDDAGQGAASAAESAADSAAGAQAASTERRLVQPDLTLWFDLPAQVAAVRRAAARPADRLEREDTAFFERVRAGYARRAADAPARFARIDADQSREAVWTQIEQTVSTRLGA